MVPYSRRDHAARSHDAAHLGDCFPGFRNEMQHEQRQCAVEHAIAEGKIAGIRLVDIYPRVGVAPDRFRDEHRRVIDCFDLAEIGVLGQRECQTSRPAADIENFFPVSKPCEVDEWERKPLTSAAHELLIAGRIVDIET